MWEAFAHYEDGTEVQRYFSYDERTNENERQYNIECWLLSRHPGCMWYSVNWMED